MFYGRLFVYFPLRLGDIVRNVFQLSQTKFEIIHIALSATIFDFKHLASRRIIITIQMTLRPNGTNKMPYKYHNIILISIGHRADLSPILL